MERGGCSLWSILICNHLAYTWDDWRTTSKVSKISCLCHVNPFSCSDYICTIILSKQTPHQFTASLTLGLSMWTGLGLRSLHAVGSFPCPMPGVATGWYES